MIYTQTKRLLAYMRPARNAFAFGLLGRSVNGLLTTWLIADLMGNAAAAFQRHSMPALWNTVLSALPLLVLIMAIQTASTWLSGKATARGTVALRSDLMDAVLKSPLKNMTQSHSGVKLSYFTNDVSAAMNTLVSSLASPLRVLVMGVGGMAYIVSVHWSLALITLGLGIACYFFSIYFAKKLHLIAMTVQRYMADMEVLIKDLLDGMVTARMYHMERHLQDRAENVAGNLCREGTRWAWLSGVLGGVNNTADQVAVRAVVFVAGLFVLGGTVDVPTLLRVSQMAGGAVGVFFVSRTLIDIQRNLAGAERIFRFLDECQAEETGGRIQTMGGDPIIRLEQVRFGYDRAADVVRSMSLSVNRGEFVAVAGASGSGKSTLLRLIQGLYMPDQGEVRIMGESVTEWDLAALRRQIALVPQEPVLFPGTLAENITIGTDGADRGKLEWAAKAAQIHDFILDLPEGYDTQVSERGDSLSGGQRQRIALARALYRDTPILLLDEATSAMDTISQSGVFETLRGLAGEKTILFVTHHAAVIELADRVLEIAGV